MGFRAVVIDEDRVAGLRELTLDDLRGIDPVGPVEIDVAYSSLNYKDGLAVSGRPGVARVHPIVAGIDLAGTVSASADPRWRPGDRVVLNGAGLSETRNGGFAERALVMGDALVRVPAALSLRQAGAIGTAGFTAMLCVLALERYGIRPELGAVLVTGASGGVGSVAIALLSRLGYDVAAATGRAEQNGGFLRDLGASELVDTSDLADSGRPLQSQRWAATIDSVGGTPLANVLAQTRYGGAVAACGLAASAELNVSMMPFILRAVALLGVNSVDAPPFLRDEAWQRLAVELDTGVLDGLTTEIGLADVLDWAPRLLESGTRGRVVVNVRA